MTEGEGQEKRTMPRLDTQRTRIMEACRRMAAEARYRPQAPGDGFGGIFLGSDELADEGVLAEESLEYARRFVREEDRCEFWIGVPCFRTVRAFVYAIEAARCLCAGTDFEGAARSLLKMAIAEMRSVGKPRT